MLDMENPKWNNTCYHHMLNNKRIFLKSRASNTGSINEKFLMRQIADLCFVIDSLFDELDSRLRDRDIDLLD